VGGRQDLVGERFSSEKTCSTFLKGGRRGVYGERQTGKKPQSFFMGKGERLHTYKNRTGERKRCFIANLFHILSGGRRGEAKARMDNRPEGKADRKGLLTKKRMRPRQKELL